MVCSSRFYIKEMNLQVCWTEWRREWQPTPEFLPGKSQGQRSLVGCSPWGCKESDITEATAMSMLD